MVNRQKIAEQLAADLKAAKEQHKRTSMPLSHCLEVQQRIRRITSANDYDPSEEQGGAIFMDREKSYRFFH